MKKLIIKLFMWAIVHPHYKAIIKRGLINKSTNPLDFYFKIKDEVKELHDEVIKLPSHVNYELVIDLAEKIGYETTDIIHTSLNFLYDYYTVNEIVDLFIKNFKTQLERAKNTPPHKK